MKVTPVQFKLTVKRSDDRSDGLHLTNITSEMARAVGILKKQAKDADDGPDPERISPGLAWEEWLSRNQHSEIMYHPGEYSKGGIAMSPDGISYTPSFNSVNGDVVVISRDGNTPVLHEFKFTWKSMGREKDLSGEWLWLSQTKAYCNAIGTCHSFWHIYWVNGDYKYDGGTGPSYRIYHVEYTPKELKENWLGIVNFAKSRGMLSR